MNTSVVNIAEKMSHINDHWNPRIAAELNGQQVKLVKLLGEFEWHEHEQEDEMFLVIKGSLTIELRDKTLEIGAGEFVVIPKQTEHRPIARSEVEVMLFEPASTLNTGSNALSQLTRLHLDKI